MSSTNVINDDITCYTLINKIGNGGFSDVYRVKERKTGEYYD